MSLYGTQRRGIRQYLLWSSSGLFGLGRAITLVRCQIFGSLDQWRHSEMKRRSHSVAFRP